MLVRTFAIVVTSLLVGCIPVPATWFDEIRYDNMARRLQYDGFSFDRPPNRKWYFLQSERSYTDTTLRRHIYSLSTTHTFYAQISLGGIEEVPSSHEEFAELARSKGQKAPYEIRTVSYEQRLTTRQNQWCIRFESSHIVIGAPQAPDSELTMNLRGFRCLHPAWPRVTLDFFYSQRGLAEEIDPKLSEEGETFLRGVRIDLAPGTPAA